MQKNSNTTTQHTPGPWTRCGTPECDHGDTCACSIEHFRNYLNEEILRMDQHRLSWLGTLTKAEQVYYQERISSFGRKLDATYSEATND